MTSIESNKKVQKSDNSTKVAWIGFAGVLLAALIAAGVTLFLQWQNKQGTTSQAPAPAPAPKVITQSVGDGTTGTVNQAGGDIHNEN